MGNVRKLTDEERAAQLAAGTDEGYKLPTASRHFTAWMVDLADEGKISHELAAEILNKFEIVVAIGFADCIHAIKVFADSLEQLRNVSGIINEAFPSVDLLVQERDPNPSDACEVCGTTTGRHTQEECYK